MVRFAKNQLSIVMIDGVLGAIIGGVSVGFETAAAAMVRDRLPLFLVGTSITVFLFAIPMFIATVALAPALLAVLRRWSHQPIPPRHRILLHGLCILEAGADCRSRVRLVQRVVAAQGLGVGGAMSPRV